MGATVALVAGFGTAASGVNWGDGTRLTAVENNKVVAMAYGNFYNNGNIYATNKATYRAVGSNEAYVRTDWSFWDKNWKGEWDWVAAGGKSTEVRAGSTWGTRYVSEPLTATGTRARGAVRVLAARPWYQANPASPYAYPTFNY